jgi:hypothetical protein
MGERMGPRIKIIVTMPESAAVSFKSATEEVQHAEKEKIRRNLVEQGAFKDVKMNLDVHFRVDHATDPLYPVSKVSMVDPDGCTDGPTYLVRTPFLDIRN